MKLTVIGAGCWGLTLAWLLTDNFDKVTVWGRQQDLSEDLIKNKHCSKPLEVQLADKVEITSDMEAAISGADIILNVVATSGTRSVCENLKKSGIKSEQILVNASKGIELPSLMRMSEVIKDQGSCTWWSEQPCGLRRWCSTGDPWSHPDRSWTLQQRRSCTLHDRPC